MRNTEPKDFRAQSVGHLVCKAARLFQAAINDELRPLGLAPAQYMTLLELWKEDGLTQGDLAGRLEVEQATMAYTLDRMARDGLIERRPHPRDRRAQSIYLTARAKTLQEAATQAATRINAMALAGGTVAEEALVLDRLHAMIDALRHHREKATS